MKKNNAIIFIVTLVLLDQILKIWIKTNMSLGEYITVFPNWFQLRFIENNGAAFGMQISSGGGFDWGKLLLSLFRVGLIAMLSIYLRGLLRGEKPDNRVVIPIALIIAGAVGNMIDCAFYGLIFTESTPFQVAEWGGGYAPLMMGKVVDMFYFPLFQWNSVPDALRFLVDGNNYFFGAIFNLADSYISVAFVLVVIFNKHIFK
ncbi:MAG: signal peptidase II [Rikenellaceae bacterium]